MTDREDIKARVRKIMERTTARGFTEAEAAEAMDKAARLMAEHGLSEDDLVMSAVRAQRPVRFNAHVRDLLAVTVARCLNCAIVKTSVMNGTGHVTYYGQDPAPQIAAYLRDMLEAAVDAELRAFRRTTHYKRKRTKKAKARAALAFCEGLVTRLNNKLWERFSSQVLSAKRRRASRYRDEQTGPLGALGAPKRSGDMDSKGLGYRAGAGVGLADGMGGGAAPLKIGRPG